MGTEISRQQKLDLHRVVNGSVMTSTNRTSQGQDGVSVPSEKVGQVKAYASSMAEPGWKPPDYIMFRMMTPATGPIL